MATQANYLGMALRVDDLDVENLEYFKHCAAHDFHLQVCAACGRLRYPPTTACPWCMPVAKSTWKKVEGKGAVHSYTEVHHAIQPAFQRQARRISILLVDLDTQKGEPTAHEALRVDRQSRHAGRQAGAARDGASGSASAPASAWCSATSPTASLLPQWTIDETRAAAGHGVALSAGIAPVARTPFRRSRAAGVNRQGLPQHFAAMVGQHDRQTDIRGRPGSK